MKDIPVPVEALNDVLPGSPWQPEHAARYNALNALLRQEESASPAESSLSRGSEVLLPVRNITEEVLPGSRAVEICPAPQPGLGIDFLRPMLFGRAVTDGSQFWGIATEDIAPGHGGLVQVGGVAVVRGVRGTPNRYVVPKPDGDFHFSPSGRAEVLYYVPGGQDQAVIYLGGGGAAGYTGMFGVTENEDNTVSVGGGMVLTSFNYGFQTIEGTTLQRPVVENQFQYVVLNALYRPAGWQLYFSIEAGDINRGYIPGEQVCWHLARLSVRPFPFVQLWQGGMIDFSSRYYIS